MLLRITQQQIAEPELNAVILPQVSVFTGDAKAKAEEGAYGVFTWNEITSVEN